MPVMPEGSGSKTPNDNKRHGKNSAGSGSGSGGDLMSLIHQAGFKGQAANIMYGIVMAESGGNATAHNTNTSTGDNSYGLAQINMLGSMGPSRLKQYGLSSNDDLFDPLTNLKVAYRMSGGGSHFGDWSTYNSGAYQQYMGQSGATVTNSGANGGSGGGGAGSDSASGGNPTMSDYQGTDSLGALLDQVPELRKLVNTALSGSWSTQKFENAVEDSHWWKHHSATARAILTQQANDPASYGQSLRNAENSVQSLASQLGFKVNSQQLNAIASSAMLSGNDSNQQWLTQQLGRLQDYTHLGNTKGLSGGMAATVQQLQSIAGDYGFNWTPGQLGQYAEGILTGKTTIDTYKQRLIGWAKSAFPSLAQEIDKGSTVKQLADPYVNSMSQLLEIDPGTIGVYTPAIRRAMQGYVDPSTKQRAAMPLVDFEAQVRQDPRWAYTQNARDTVSTALVHVGQDFGFAV